MQGEYVELILVLQEEKVVDEKATNGDIPKIENGDVKETNGDLKKEEVKEEVVEEKKEETPKKVSTTIFKVQKKRSPATQNTRAAPAVKSEEDGVTSFSTVLGWVPTWPEFATTKQNS